ncbi:hypothetical protein QP938_07355 [Porticoccaceae bacterium LTM1]|nr:hypothetical protein QP938_07355 [Porticoccaceae bacterium LTM1]
MASNLYEIVQLPDGEYALQRSDGDGEPLVRIRFSKEAQHFLRNGSSAVARAMIDAGIEAVEQLSDGEVGGEAKIKADKPRVLH